MKALVMLVWFVDAAEVLILRCWHRHVTMRNVIRWDVVRRHTTG